LTRVVATVGPVAISAAQVIAVALTLVLSATHYIGVRKGARIQGVFTLLIVLALVWLAGGGLISGAHAAPSPAAAMPAPPIGVAAFGTAMIAVFWCFYGWSDIVAVAGEVARPERNLPLALILGTALITALYLAVNVVLLRVIPPAEMASTSQPAALAAERLFGPASKTVLALAVTAAAAGCASAGLLAGPRIVYAMAKDGLFPKAFARVHPRFQTPSFAIVVQAIWMSVLCLSGRYDQLYTYATFAIVIAYAATGVALFLYRKRLPGLARPYRCWGYPVVPILFVASSAALAVNTVREQPRETFAGLAILAAGVPVYYWMRARARRSPA
jgi:basic amino acid/polyamine antiporter, APA family